MSDIFKKAVQAKLRYPTKVGNATTEDLYDLPLTSANGASLDDTAKAISRNLKQFDEESFVDTAVNRGKATAELQLEVVKAVIADKVEARDAAKDAKAKAERKQKILEIMARKQDSELEDKSLEELEKELAEL